MEMTPVQLRVVGCLIEKELATPDNYPLTMNALLAACNQTSNRNPVVNYNEATVSNALENLRAAGLARIVYSRSNRADKYRHVLHETCELEPPELAVLSVLMLRGPQTLAELRTRTERLHPFTSTGEVEEVLRRLASRTDEPLVVAVERQPGQKEGRWAQLLGGEAALEAQIEAAASSPGSAPRNDRVVALEESVQALRDEVDRLRADHDALSEKLRALLD
jgi:uncharacterized protein YceH (UPF0502 family)